MEVPAQDLAGPQLREGGGKDERHLWAPEGEGCPGAEGAQASPEPTRHTPPEAPTEPPHISRGGVPRDPSSLRTGNQGPRDPRLGWPRSGRAQRLVQYEA